MILLTLKRAPKLSNVPGLLIGMYAVSQALVNQIPSTLKIQRASKAATYMNAPTNVDTAILTTVKVGMVNGTYELA